MEVIKAYCKKLRLSNLIKFIDENESKEKLDYVEYLFKMELESRRNNRINRNMNIAKFGLTKSIHDFSFEGVNLPSSIDIKDLSSCKFVDRQENLILYGRQGTGKTHLAIALGTEAIKNEKKVQFYKVSKLVNDLVEAKEKGLIHKKLKQLSKLDLLVIDEWGYTSIDSEGAKLLFQVIADCYERISIIITTNLEFGKWNTLFYDEKLTAAIIDRLIHHSHLVIFERESYRVKHSLMKEK